VSSHPLGANAQHLYQHLAEFSRHQEQGVKRSAQLSGGHLKDSQEPCLQLQVHILQLLAFSEVSYKVRAGQLIFFKSDI
jgi:hypothetical protein